MLVVLLLVVEAKYKANHAEKSSTDEKFSLATNRGKYQILNTCFPTRAKPLLPKDHSCVLLPKTPPPAVLQPHHLFSTFRQSEDSSEGVDL